MVKHNASLLALILIVGQLHAQPSGPTGGTSDEALTRAVRAALAADESLGGLHIGVRVRQGRVTLLGTVPNRQMLERARACARSVAGVVEVQSELNIFNPSELLNQLSDIPDQPNRPAPPVVILPDAPELLVPARTEGSPLPAAPPTPPRQLPMPFLHGASGVHLGLPAGNLHSHPELPLPQIPIAQFTARHTVISNPLADQIDSLRLGDVRFHGLQVQLTGGVVHIWGIVNRASDVWLLAEQIASIPGVERVVIGKVNQR
jgi:hypothetical protein